MMRAASLKDDRSVVEYRTKKTSAEEHASIFSTEFCNIKQVG